MKKSDIFDDECPNCKAHGRSDVWVTSWSMSGLFNEILKRTFKCNKCDHTWEEVSKREIPNPFMPIKMFGVFDREAMNECVSYVYAPYIPEVLKK